MRVNLRLNLIGGIRRDLLKDDMIQTRQLAQQMRREVQELVDVLNEFGVTECYYGHLHGKSIRYATQGERDGITYRLISADGLSFCPYKIR